ncbi:UNKNOWN [Stylonychia lemnae]|uniref:Ion transport domain-containing protein n=1 Tax=Stylonychia lemnae TaxID=5949 RepID=A0A077ZSG5_STYLE|nr:UNKNOWN [Stylonychia lemnae]|eukprot:CDW71411.1 UNKNOWN [Stylonychia lemnae]
MVQDQLQTQGIKRSRKRSISLRNQQELQEMREKLQKQHQKSNLLQKLNIKLIRPFNLREIDNLQQFKVSQWGCNYFSEQFMNSKDHTKREDEKTELEKLNDELKVEGQIKNGIFDNFFSFFRPSFISQTMMVSENRLSQNDEHSIRKLPTSEEVCIKEKSRHCEKKKISEEIFFKTDFFQNELQFKFSRTHKGLPRKKFLIYPDSAFKIRWDLLITMYYIQYILFFRLLLYTCIQCPYSIAFLDNPGNIWIIVNAIVDFLFLVDVAVNFFSAFYDKELELIDDKKVIAKSYISSWFAIDFLSIIPFDMLYDTSGFNRMSRVVRIGKIYKIVKMTRMVRMLKIVKERNKFVKYLNQALQIGIGFERLIFLLIIFLVMCHVTACYGDIHAYSIGEKYMSIILMIIGVISFSFATGALSNIISNYDASQAQLKEKMATLNDIRTKYLIDPELFDELRKTIKYDHSKNFHDVTKFMNELPYKLKIELALEIHKDIYREIEFFKKQDKNFIVWVCPLLRPFLVSEQDYIYKEGDDIKERVAGYVIPRFDNTVYIQIDKGDHFGELDLVYDPKILSLTINIKKKAQKNKDIFRRFSVQAIINCELLILTLDDIDKMKLEFPEVFDDLFNNSLKRLEKVLKLKIDAVEQCESVAIKNINMQNRRFSVFTRLQQAMSKENDKRSEYIQQYKTQRLKRNLTISDVQQIANFSTNKASLKQIDEEIESQESSDESSSSNSLNDDDENEEMKSDLHFNQTIRDKSIIIDKKKKKMRKSVTRDDVTNNEIDNLYGNKKVSKKNKSIMEESSSDSKSVTSEESYTFKESKSKSQKSQKSAIRKQMRKKISHIFSRHKMSVSINSMATFKEQLDKQRKHALNLNKRVDDIEGMMKQMMGHMIFMKDSIIEIKDHIKGEQ